MTRKLVGPAIKGLLRSYLIYKNTEEELFLNYAKDSNNRYFNINFESKFNQVIKSTHKRLILLFYYFLLREQPKNWYSINIRELYSTFYKYRLVNSLNDLLSNIIQLVTSGLIEVKLGSQMMFTEAVVNPRAQIQNYYREIRLGEKIGYPIQFRINPKILKNRDEQNAMRYNVVIKEFDIIAREYHCSIDFFTDDLQADIYNVKHKIFCKYGNLGMGVYRDSLREFFEEYDWKFELLVESKEFADIFWDQFFVPRMEAKVIIND